MLILVQMPVRCYGYSNFISQCIYNSQQNLKINKGYHNVLHHDNTEHNNKIYIVVHLRGSKF
jgi:hypothetical protein